MLVVKALEAALKECPDVPAETWKDKPAKPARRADALGMLAESFLKHGFESLNGAERHQIVVHVDAATLRGVEPGCCDLEHGPSMPSETARRLACDASIVTLVEDENGEPLSIGRKSRTLSTPIRRALNARDKGCRVPGCPNKHYVDGHHIKHWAHGGETKLSNLVSLCRFHHRQVHEGNLRVETLDDGALRFFKADNKPINAVPPLHSPTDWTQLTQSNHSHAIQITQDTATSRWRGESIDYGLAIELLMLQEQRAQNVSAETSSRSAR